MLAEWLRGNDGQTLEAADMRGRIAACDYRMGHYQDGWSMAEPALESWHMNPMAWGALNLAGLGRAEEARRLASNVITRYASADAVSTAAEVEWRLGDPSAAAKRFREPPLPLTDIDFERDVGKAFVRIYSARPPADAVRAVEALLSVVRRASLDELGIALENAKAYEQAFAVHERLAQGAGVEGGTRFFILLRAADALEKVRGVAASREWLAAQLPRPLSDFDARQLALLAFMNGLPQLVWELPAEPKGGEDEAETFWMLRAAAVALQGADAPAERRDALHRHYASTKSLSHYFALGQYLMGELPESDAAKMVTNNTRACEYPYYFALKATGEKRFADASDWYHVALECGSRQEAEYRFAQADLYRWRAEKNPFAKLNGATATAGAPR